MGIFDKIKSTFNIGGPKFKELRAPYQISLSDPHVTLEFVLVNREQACHINSFELTLIKITKRQVVNGNGSQEQTDRHNIRTQRYDNDGQGWDLQPQAELAQQLDLPLNMELYLQQQTGRLLATNHPEIPAGGEQVISGVNNFMGKLMQAAESMDTFGNVRYELRVRADVDGVAFDPAIDIKVHVLRPGEISTSTGINVAYGL